MKDFRPGRRNWPALIIATAVCLLALAASTHADAPGLPGPVQARAILIDQLDTIASLLEQQGAWLQAEPVRRLAFEARTRDPSTSICQRAAATSALAVTLASAGRTDEARQRFEESIAQFRRCGGPSATGLAGALQGQGELLRDAGELDAAEKSHLEALDLLRSALGPDDPRTALGEIYLACVYQDQGRVDAVKRLEKAVDQVRRTRGDRHPDYAWSLGRFGSAVADATPDRARTLLRSAVDIERQLPRQNHPNLAADLFALGCLELRAGDPAAAEPLLLEALDIDLLRFGPDHLQTARTRSMLGEALTKLQRFKEAEPLLRAAYDTLVQKLPPVGPECTEARQRLIDYFDASGQSTMAEIYRTHP